MQVPEKLIIEGNRALYGTVKISGAKNSVLKLMGAAILTQSPVELRNVPQLSDVHVMTEVLAPTRCHGDAKRRRHGD